MENFFIQIQTIKSHIDNMSLQITNIISQYNYSQSQVDQLINLGIQMLNTGIYSFNLGKSKYTSSLDNYYIQLKNISEQINNIIKSDEMSLQQQMMQQQIIQQQMMLQQQQMMQQQIMQEQMINQLNLDNIVDEGSNKPKMNITFRFSDSSKLNLICDYGCSIKEVFDLLEKKIGKSKYNFNFSLNGKRLNHNDERIIEKTFHDGTIINAFEKGR